MSLRIQLAFLLCLLGATGCRTDMTISENRHVPKRPAFSFGPGDYSGTDLLDFNAIYYTTHETHSATGPSKSFNYYRFWPTGHVLSDFADHLPSRSEAEDFSHAYIGFFRLKDHGIVMEFFAPDTGQWKWDYGREYGFIENGSIVLTNAVIGSRSWTNRSVFTKYPIEGLVRKPDW